MQTYKMIPCHEPDLTSVFLLEIVEDILQHLVFDEVTSLGLAKKFSANLLMYMRHVLCIEDANRDINLLKRLVCGQFKRIAETHTQLDVHVITYCIEEINRDITTILAELMEQSERVAFFDNLENICHKYMRDLTINAYSNNVLMPSNIAQEIPLDIDQNITVVDFNFNDNPLISDLEAGLIHNIRTAFYFQRLGDRESLLKAIAIYNGVLAHFEDLKSLSLNFTNVTATVRFNLLQLTYSYALTLAANQIEELIIYHRNLLQQSLQLDHYPDVMAELIAQQRDNFKRQLARTLTRFIFSKQFSYRKMTQGLSEIIALHDDIQLKTSDDMFENRCVLTTLALVNLQYGLYISNQFSNFQDAERRMLLANQYYATAYLGINREFCFQPMFSIRQVFLILSIMENISLEKRFYYLQACEDEFARIPEHQLIPEMRFVIAVVQRNIAAACNEMGKRYNANSSKENLMEAKKIFISIALKMKMIKPPYRLPMDDEQEQYAYLFYGITCIAYLLKTDDVTSKAFIEELFLAIDSCSISRTLYEQSSAYYFDSLRSFINLLTKLADRIGNFEGSYFALKVCLQTLSIYKYLVDANPLTPQLLQNLQTQLLKFTYQYIFSIEETYERVLPEHMNVILEAVEQFENINPTSLSSLNKFHYTSIQMELKKMLIACEDLMSIRLKEMQKEYSFEYCFFKSRSVNDKELFVNNNDVINRVKHKNVFPLFKKLMNHWIKMKGGLNTDNEHELLDDAKYVQRMGKLLMKFDRRGCPQNISEVSASDERNEDNSGDRPRRYSF